MQAAESTNDIVHVQSFMRDLERKVSISTSVLLIHTRSEDSSDSDSDSVASVASVNQA